MANQVLNETSATGEEGNKAFNFNQWITKHGLTAIKNAFIERDMNTLNTINMVDNKNFAALMSDYRVLQNTDLIPKIIGAIQSLEVLRNKQDKTKLVYMTKNENIILQQINKYVKNMDQLKDEFKTMNDEYENKKVNNKNKINQYQIICQSQLDNITEKIAIHIAKLHEIIAKREQKLKSIVNAYKKQVGDVTIKHKQTVTVLDSTVNNLHKMINDEKKHFEEEIISCKNVIKTYGDTYDTENEIIIGIILSVLCGVNVCVYAVFIAKDGCKYYNIFEKYFVILLCIISVVIYISFGLYEHWWYLQIISLLNQLLFGFIELDWLWLAIMVVIYLIAGGFYFGPVMIFIKRFIYSIYAHICTSFVILIFLKYRYTYFVHMNPEEMMLTKNTFNYKLYLEMRRVISRKRLLMSFLCIRLILLALSPMFSWIIWIELIICVWIIFLLNKNNIWIVNKYFRFFLWFKNQNLGNSMNIKSMCVSYDKSDDTNDDLLLSVSDNNYYTDNKYNETIQNCKSNVNECKSVERVIKLLNDYNRLNVVNNKDMDKLVEICEENKSTLNDYIHIITHHNNEYDLEEIFNLIIEEINNECNLRNCSFISRHYRDRTVKQSYEIKEEESKYNEETTKVIFWMDLLDSMHCFLFHMYDTGMRVKKNGLNKIIDKKEEKYEEFDEYYDVTFANIYYQIKTKIKTLQSSGIIGRYENNKFNIIAANDTSINKDKTFMDRLFEISSGQMMHTLKEWLCEEDYDTEAVQTDIENVSSDNFTQTNIGQQLQDKLLYQRIANFIHDAVDDAKLYSVTFSNGFRFMYWDHYKEDPLYVKTKYNSLKDELMNKLPLDQYELSVTKAEKFIQTEKAKSIKLSDNNYTNDPLKYGKKYSIGYGSRAISWEHLLVIVIYCDQTDLCTEFTASFRKKTIDESLENVKKRNAEFSIWARLLRETVEYFGQTGFDQRKRGQLAQNKLYGPFFCGMSFVMVMPEMNIKLCGPTSTSLHVEIATRFAGPIGVLIQLNNDATQYTKELSGFPCAWLSSHPQESEVLFCGGTNKLQIESVTNIRTKQNWCNHCGPLFLFDCMISDGVLSAKYVDDKNNNKKMKKAYTIINELIDHKLGTDTSDKPPHAYIEDT
eukprot:336384_1